MSKLTVFIENHEELAATLEGIFNTILGAIGLDPADRANLETDIANFKDTLSKIGANLEQINSVAQADPAQITSDATDAAVAAAKAAAADALADLPGLIADAVTKNTADLLAKAGQVATDAANAAVAVVATDVETLRTTVASLPVADPKTPGDGSAS